MIFRAPHERRWVAPWLLAGYVVFLAWVLFNPTADVASAVVGGVANLMHDAGLSATLVTDSRVEFTLNALMFVPAAFLTATIWPRVSWQGWTTYTFLASCTVELLQGLFLPDRAAQFEDVVSNSLGGLVGALGALWWRLRRERGARG